MGTAGSAPVKGPVRVVPTHPPRRSDSPQLVSRIGATHRFPSVTPEGNTVVFESSAENFITGDDNGLTDVYVGHGPAAILVDGFSSGDTTGWSSTIP